MTEPNDRQGRRWLVPVVAVVLVSAVVGVGVLVLRGHTAAAVTVTLESAVARGPDPFTASVQLGPVVDFPGNVKAIAASTRKALPSDPQTRVLVAKGTAPGLYGGSGRARACDPTQLVHFLTAHADKAAAWARVIGIAPTDIPRYVGTLTPLVLTADTMVANHGYRNGVATLRDSVLQAGTAVLVDATGVPRVKCNCGNPLTEPEPLALARADVRGAPWTGYAPSSVTVVHPGSAVGAFTVVDIESGDAYRQPVAGAPAPAPPTVAQGWVATEYSGSATPSDPFTTTIATSTDGSSWSTVAVVPTQLDALAYGQGTWVAIDHGVEGAGEPTILKASTDLRAWKQVARLDLYDLTGIAYGGGRWVATGVQRLKAPNQPSPIRVVAFTSTDAVDWTQTDLGVDQPNALSVSVAYGNGAWLAASEAGPSTVLYRSPDGLHWTTEDRELTGISSPSLAYGAGHWLVAGTPAVGQPPSAYLSSDGVIWIQGGAFPGGAPGVGPVAYGNGEFLAVAAPSQGAPVFTSPDGRRWSPHAAATFSALALAFGPVPAVTAPPPTSPSSTTAPASASPCGPLTSASTPLHALTPATGHVSKLDPTWGVLRPDDPAETSNIDVMRCTGGTWTVAYLDGMAAGECMLVAPEDEAPAEIRKELGLFC